MGISKLSGGLAAVLALLGCAVYAQEVSQNSVATKTDWSVFVEDDPKECWGVAVPEKSEATRQGRLVAVNRGQIQLMVFYRPGSEAAGGQVVFTGGYPFQSGSQVTMNIGGTEYSLFADGEWAWPSSTADDQKIVASMKRGADAILTGVSSRGTTTTDTFSLLGFTAAVEEAEKRCAG